MRFTRGLFAFPNPVNDYAARTVAAGVLTLCVAILATRQMWLLVPLAYGFVARVATGPTLSPLGQLATRFITPRLPVEAKLVPGPPKRFAQAMGATMSLGAVLAYYGFGSILAAMVLVAMIVVAATLESVFGFCLGCTVFAALMRIGVIPASACEACANVSLRGATAIPS